MIKLLLLEEPWRLWKVDIAQHPGTTLAMDISLTCTMASYIKILEEVRSCLSLELVHFYQM
jgi:hypothetical protein